MTLVFNLPPGIIHDELRRHLIDEELARGGYLPGIPDGTIQSDGMTGTYDTKGNKLYVTFVNSIAEINAQPIIQHWIDQLWHKYKSEFA